MNIPENLLYSKDHEWIAIDGDIATVGITDFAQNELGDIVYIDVDTIDETLEQDEVFGSIEAVKTVSDLFIPLEGEVVEFNDVLEDEPELVNNDPYSNGWIVKIKISNTNTEHLLDAEAYKELIGA